jgi:hypothetical protein
MKNMSQVWVLYWIFSIIINNIIIIQFVCNILGFWHSFFIVIMKQIRLLCEQKCVGFRSLVVNAVPLSYHLSYDTMWVWQKEM